MDSHADLRAGSRLEKDLGVPLGRRVPEGAGWPLNFWHGKVPRSSAKSTKRTCRARGSKAAGCERIFEEKASGAQRDRPELALALSHTRPPLIADDADVSVIAGHASRMALDTLMRPEASAFPHPAYVIGLAQAWIFTEPFDVRPVDFANEGTWQAEITQGQADKAI